MTRTARYESVRALSRTARYPSARAGAEARREQTAMQEDLLAVPRPQHRDLDADELELYARELALRPELWIDHVLHDPAQRKYRELLRDDHVSVWVISWMQGHDTGFHDHDLSAGAVAVLGGRVCEERLALGRAAERSLHSAGRTFSFSAAAIHRVRHHGSDPAVTLHAYSPPLARMGTYSIGDDGALERHPVASEQELRPLSVVAASGRTREHSA